MKEFLGTILKLSIALIILGYISLIVYALLPLEETPTKELAAKEDLFIEINGYNIRYREYQAVK